MVRWTAFFAVACWFFTTASYAQLKVDEAEALFAFNGVRVGNLPNNVAWPSSTASADADAAREIGRRAFVASKAGTNRVNGERIYTVKQGDCFARLSIQFNGRPSKYERISTQTVCFLDPRTSFRSAST